jgi:hypothetical protein
MAKTKVLHLLGKFEAVVFRIPLIGEPLLRGIVRLLGRLFFYLPYMGGKKCRTVGELKSDWITFVNRFGIYPTVTGEDDKAFRWSIDACAYGFSCSRDRGVCDAMMDLDRTYIRLMGGELEILERIPLGADTCRFVTRLREC